MHKQRFRPATGRPSTEIRNCAGITKLTYQRTNASSSAHSPPESVIEIISMNNCYRWPVVAYSSLVSRYLNAAAATTVQTPFLYLCRKCSSSSTSSDNYTEVLISQPFRSLLYVPASNTRALEKQSTLQGSNQPDGIIIDLEDGVIPAAKDAARQNLVHYFQRDQQER